MLNLKSIGLLYNAYHLDRNVNIPSPPPPPCSPTENVASFSRKTLDGNPPLVKNLTSRCCMFLWYVINNSMVESLYTKWHPLHNVTGENYSESTFCIAIGRFTHYCYHKVLKILQFCVYKTVHTVFVLTCNTAWLIFPITTVIQTVRDI